MKPRHSSALLPQFPHMGEAGGRGWRRRGHWRACPGVRLASASGTGAGLTDLCPLRSQCLSFNAILEELGIPLKNQKKLKKKSRTKGKSAFASLLTCHPRRTPQREAAGPPRTVPAGGCPADRGSHLPSLEKGLDECVRLPPPARGTCPRGPVCAETETDTPAVRALAARWRPEGGPASF